jgi:hypothetical protein
MPGSEGMPYFAKANITEFIKRFKDIYNNY